MTAKVTSKKKPPPKNKAATKAAKKRKVAVPKKKALAKKKPAKKTPTKPRPMGRPTLYKEQYAEEVYRLCLLGMIDTQLADIFEVSEKTLNQWKKAHPKFYQSMKKGKEIADGEVASALYSRAIGMTVPDVHIANYMGDTIVTDIDKHLPPDVQAARFWLKNRQPEKWREIVNVADAEGGILGIHIHEALKGEE